MRLPDIRLQQMAREIIWRTTKPGANPRSADFLRLVLADKSQSVLFATFPKSGWNWTVDVLTYAVAKQFFGRFDITYSDNGTLKQREQKPLRIFYPADSRAAGMPTVRLQFPALAVDYCLHTHGFWRESPLWRLDDATTILVTRHIPTALFSYYNFFKTRAPYNSFESCLADGILDRVIGFYNSWGAFSERSTTLHQFCYEELHRDPLAGFATMFAVVFGIAADLVVLAEAIDYYDFANQKRREKQFSADATHHFHFHGATDYTDRIAPATLEMIVNRLNSELTHKFGYDYTFPPSS